MINLLNTKPRRRKIKVNAGAPPGTVIYTGRHKVDDVVIHYLEYNGEHLRQEKCSPGEFIEFHEPSNKYMQWYDVHGLTDEELIDNLGATFGIHSLVQEDIANTTQRPKYEEFDEGIYLSIRALEFDEEEAEIHFQQVSLFFTDTHVLSFQESDDDLLAGIRNRLTAKHGRVSHAKADYLAYAIIDHITDHYFLVMDKVHDVLHELEDEVNDNPRPEIKGKFLNLKNQLIKARKAIFPMREIFNEFSRSESKFIQADTIPYARDGYDHVIQLMDMVETSREILTGIQDLYAAEISYRMNKVMQFLAVITTIFVPITFLAGLYGMNFSHIPELDLRYGYFYLLGIMALVTIILIIFFKRKRWL